MTPQKLLCGVYFFVPLNILIKMEGQEMISTDKLKNKEVINISDGRSIGFVYDIEVDLELSLIHI